MKNSKLKIFIGKIRRFFLDWYWRRKLTKPYTHEQLMNDNGHKFRANMDYRTNPFFTDEILEEIRKEQK